MLLVADEVVAHVLAPMRGMRVHAEDVDLAVHGPHTRLDLVERAHHVLLRVTAHGATDGILGDLLDHHVEELGTCVNAWSAHLEHIEREVIAEERCSHALRLHLD